MSHKKRTVRRTLNLGVESLEGRNLLSALHAVAAVVDHTPNHVAAHVSTAHQNTISVVGTTGGTTTGTTGTTTVGSGGGCQGEQNEIHLTTTLVASGTGTTTGTAFYESGTEHGTATSSLKISVTGATAGSTITVTIPDSTGAPFTLGTITVGTNGTGTLSLSSNPQGTQIAFPANTPTIAAGTVVSLNATDSTGTSSVVAGGTLATPTSTTGTGHGGHETNETHLGATLTDPASTLTGKASFETETEHSLSITEFRVRLKGGTAGSVINVSIADASGNTVSVGTITIGANGTGMLSLSSNPYGKYQSPLPANFPTVAAGSSIILSSVNPTTGALTQITTANLA